MMDPLISGRRNGYRFGPMPASQLAELFAAWGVRYAPYAHLTALFVLALEANP